MGKIYMGHLHSIADWSFKCAAPNLKYLATFLVTVCLRGHLFTYMTGSLKCRESVYLLNRCPHIHVGVWHCYLCA